MLSPFSFSDDTIGFLLEGVIDEATFDSLHSQIREKWEVYGKISLYIEDTGIETLSIIGFIKELLFKIENPKRFHKIALVSDRKWIYICGAIEDLFIEAKVKNFASEERLEAISWIAQK